MAFEPPPGERTAVTEIRRDEPPPGPPPWWREHWWIFLVVLLLIVGGIIAFFALRGGDDGGEDGVLVPDVVGLPEADARARLQAEGLSIEILREPSDEGPGIVFAQAPGAGSRLAEGQAVRIHVSTGPAATTAETETVTETVTTTESEPEPPATAAMPDVAGLAYADAAEAILDVELLPDGYPVPSDEPAGTVVAQRPDPGAEVERGANVRVNVSLGGEERPLAEVPDVTGPELEEAYAACVDAGFTCRVVRREAPSDEEVGEVIDQRPAAGTGAPRLSQVTLFLGS